MHDLSVSFRIREELEVDAHHEPESCIEVGTTNVNASERQFLHEMLALVSNQPGNEGGMLRSVGDGLSMVRNLVNSNVSDILSFRHPPTKIRETVVSDCTNLIRQRRT